MYVIDIGICEVWVEGLMVKIEGELTLVAY